MSLGDGASKGVRDQVLAALTPEAFERWLRSEPASRAWEVGSATHGPLAEFLREEAGVKASVYQEAIEVPGQRRVETPEWAAMYLDEEDSSPRDAVTRDDVLEMLKVVGVI